MPVEDHPISDKVRHAKPPAGCYNSSPAADGYWAQDGYEFVTFSPSEFYRTYQPKFVFIPHAMSTKCRQTLQLPECEGCTAEKDIEYIERWKNAT